MQDAAMELLINTLAQMKKDEVNKQLEDALIEKLHNPQRPSNLVFQQNAQSTPALDVEDTLHDDFDTQITNDFDSTLQESLSKSLGGQRMSPKQNYKSSKLSINSSYDDQQQKLQTNDGKSSKQITQSNEQQQNKKKLTNFLDRGKTEYRDEVQYVKAQVITDEQPKPAKKYTIRKYQYETEPEQTEQPKQTQIKKTTYQHKIKVPEEPKQEQPKRVFHFKQPKLLREQDTQTTQNEHQDESQQEKQSRQKLGTTHIIQIIEMPKKDKKPKTEKKSKPQVEKKSSKKEYHQEPCSPLIIKEQIINRGKQEKRKKYDLAVDIAAAVAAEYEKQLQKFNEEEGNKTVPEAELRELSMLINEPPPQFEQKPIQKPEIIQEESSATSQGEIWPAYDKNTAQVLRDKGRGIGVWDRSVTERWDYDDDASEGEITIYRMQPEIEM